MSQYRKDKHDGEPILCPRQKCRRKNAPKESDDFSPRCWKCNTFLNITPVNQGDVLEVSVEDIHENGSGVGKTDDGYVVLVEGVLPPTEAKVRITNVKPNFANAELIEKIEKDSEEESENDDSDGNDEESDENEDYAGDHPSLGSRENYWG